MIVLMLLNLSFASSMLEASLGVVGRDESSIPAASKAYQYVEKEQWSSCAQSFHQIAQTRKKYRNEALMWTMICHMRAEDLQNAYVVLGDLIAVAEEVGWPLLLVESWLLQELGAHKEALRLLRDYPEREQEYIGASILKMRSYSALQRHRQVHRLEVQMIETGQADAWFWLALARRSSGPEKERLIETAIDSPRRSAVHYLYAINHYEDANEPSNVLRCGLEGLNTFAGNQGLQEKMIAFAASPPGRTVFEQKVSDVPEHSKAQAVLGLSLLQEGNFERSKKHLASALQYGERQVEMYEALHQAQMASGDSEKAWETLKTAVTEHPTSEKLWTQLDEASVSDEQKKSFLRLLNNTWEQGTRHSVALVRRAFRSALSVQDPEGALLWAEREISIVGGSWRALSRKAIALTESNRQEEAIKMYEKALQLDPENSFVLNNLAWLLANPNGERDAEPQRALQLAQRAIDNSPKPVAGYYDTLASILWALGRKTEAVSAQHKAVELDPSQKKYQDRQRKYELSSQ